MSFCIKCGSQVGDNEKFCGNCGQPVEGIVSKKTISINGKKAFADYFKHPVSTIKTLSGTLDVKSTAIILSVVLLLSAYIPFKPVKSMASVLTSTLSLFGSEVSNSIDTKVNLLYFTFLLLTIIFFVIGILVILIYANIRGRKESFISSLNLFVLCSIPAVLAMLLSALIFGVNSFSIVLMAFGLSLSGILLYSQFRENLKLSELDSFIALVLVNVITLSATSYIAYIIIKAQLSSLEKLL